LVEEITSRLQNATWLSSDAGMVSSIVFCGVVVVAQALLIPVSPFSICAGFTFGFWHGTFVIVCAKMLSAAVNFSLSRWLAKNWGKRLASRYPFVQTMNELIANEGFGFIVLLRMCPVPFSVANYGYGLTQIRPLLYGLATFISILIPSFTLTALGASVHEGLRVIKDGEHEHIPWQTIGTFASVVAMVLVARRIASIAMKKVKETKGGRAASPHSNEGSPD
jgi:uncharacterized membrane protein YdjX (TVP38/TMEM64 family)